VYSFIYYWTKKKLNQKLLLSWLTGIALLFRQDHTPVKTKLILLFAFCGWILSVCYECFVQAEQIIPLKTEPYNNLSQLLQAGYKYPVST